MVDLSTVLPILLYLAGLVLLIVLIIVGIKLIGLLDKFDRIADNVEVKITSLDGAFNIVDKFSDSVAMVSDSLVSGTVKLLSNVFGKNKTSICKAIVIKAIFIKGVIFRMNDFDCHCVVDYFMTILSNAWCSAFNYYFGFIGSANVSEIHGAQFMN